MMAFMFPTVMLTVNLSSVAVVWFGADRIASGEMQVGSLVAFLSYLIQILMAVMMGTFVVSMAPRAAVCAERIGEVLDTRSSVVTAAEPVTELARPASLELPWCRVLVPRRREGRPAPTSPSGSRRARPSRSSGALARGRRRC